ncbi:MAG: iron-containing alcohol dehydrogenase [Roseovarius sp.]
MTNFLQPADWSFPIPIHYGPGRLADLPRLCREQCIARPMIVTDRGSAGLPFLEDATRLLAEAGISSTVFYDVDPNPTDSNIFAGKTAFEQGGHDGIIALGGGSGLDGGKAIALLAGQGKQDLWAFDLDHPPEKGPPQIDTFVPLICVPTTAGTGAETESTSMIIQVERGAKRCVWHKNLKPCAALLDPEITVGLPRNLTVWTGLDALTHAIEAYSVDAFHPICDGAALEGLRLVHTHLDRSAAQPDSLADRGGMMVGSCLAGVSFLKGLGLVHAMAHMIGAEFNTHHGLTNAVLLPVVLRFNEATLGAKARIMAQAIGLEDQSFNGLYKAICALLDRQGIPVGLRDLGVTREALPRIAGKAHHDGCRATNPRPSTRQEIEALLNEAFEAGR